FVVSGLTPVGPLAGNSHIEGVIWAYMQRIIPLPKMLMVRSYTITWRPTAVYPQAKNILFLLIVRSSQLGDTDTIYLIFARYLYSTDTSAYDMEVNVYGPQCFEVYF